MDGSYTDGEFRSHPARPSRFNLMNSGHSLRESCPGHGVVEGLLMLSSVLLYDLGPVLSHSGPDMPCLDKRVLWSLPSFLVLEFCGFENRLKEEADRG